MSKNPFGLRDGRIVMIEDIAPEERGYRCNCVCPNCKERFIAAIGEKEQPHFRHGGEPCDEKKMMMTALYGLFQDALKEKGVFLCPGAYGGIRGAEIWVSPRNENGLETIVKPCRVKAKAFEIQTKKNGMPKAMLITTSHERQFAVVLTPPDTVCRSSKAKPFKDFPSVSIDMNQKNELFAKFDFYHTSSEKLKTLLVDEVEGKEWIGESNPKIVEWKKANRPTGEEWLGTRSFKRAPFSGTNKMQGTIGWEHFERTDIREETARRNGEVKMLQCPKCKRWVSISSIPTKGDDNSDRLCIRCFRNIKGRDR